MNKYNEESIEKEVNERLAETKTPNVLICGQTGSGKSSIVNFIFKDDIAKVGHSEPCTRDIKLFKGDCVNIYDSEGYEIGSEKQTYYQKLLFDDFLEHKQGLKDDDVHLVWYCVSGAGTRYTDLDISLIRKISDKGFAVAILLSKIDEMDEEQLNDMRKSLNSDFKDIPIFQLTTDKDENVQAFADWDALITWSIDSLGETFKTRFVAGLRDGLKYKKTEALRVIALASASSAGVGASPIPFSDAMLLVPIQTAMIIKVLSIYDIKVKDSSIVSLLGSVGTSALGKSIAGNIIKAIPGIGTTIGGVINATIASSLTGAIGIAIQSICHDHAQRKLNGENVVFDIDTILSSSEFIKNIIKEFSNSRAGK